MPKPYSEDLRERVLKVVNERKMTMKAMSEMFSIDRKTLYWWRKRMEETGSIKPSSGYQTGHRSKIKDMGAFSNFCKIIKMLQLIK